mgnify:CR=1 FL=1
MNRTVFFNYVRKAPFGNSISQNQVNGLKNILDYKESNYPSWSNEYLAYALATVFHETAATIQPVKEYGGEKYLKSKPYYPYYGRGYVQLTWKRNYELYGIADKPDKALDPAVSVKILFQGMERGVFTGKKLSDYFNSGKSDPVGARRIINGTDKAKLIAGYYKNFLDALNAADEALLPKAEQTMNITKEDKEALPKPASLLKDPVGILNTGIAGVGAGGTLFGAINNPYAFGFGIVLLVIAVAGFYFWNKNRKNTPV